MIEVRGLSMRYGRTLAVDDLTCTVKPGLVTGFLGPNGAGKSTTMRAVLGLEVPASGEALVDGRPYASLRRPMRTMGALLDAGAVHGGRSARDHLGCLARSNGIDRARVTAVLDQVGLTDVAGKRIGGFSLGMKQRLGMAAALLGDPAVLMFDEPLNGLDPEGIRWLRGLLRSLADEGRTVLLSSHLMNETALTADHVIVIGRGRLIADAAMNALAAHFQGDVLVRTRHPERLTAIMRAHGGTVVAEDDGVQPVARSAALSVHGLDASEIGVLALSQGIALVELTPRAASLEEAFMRLTEDSTEYRSESGTTPKETVR
ncbi:ATP-binding cassette domain-containing protein [Nonomuraea sp. KC401]|uniref:ATP-binding cassette domain-containing protein n=1 Tax=unclassified Nonomuraea TaxID=2593643 RepID=UPI0010FF3FCD|nr:ATP-binding cassette domain-containing protein [Nonomuraea sp. KC401]NBE92482.1 ATP-binding cassette domain-containing protein [Nonomuraea sp. K271]TLF84822.1 ATP-binding cassette domain-containing protein [Nonomuraea sp. KC401]